MKCNIKQVTTIGPDEVDPKQLPIATAKFNNVQLSEIKQAYEVFKNDALRNWTMQNLAIQFRSQVHRFKTSLLYTLNRTVYLYFCFRG